MAFSPGGAPLVAGRGNEIQLWDLQTGRATARLRHEEDVRGVRFSPEEGILATFSGAGVSVWDYARATLLSRIPGGGVVFDLRFSPDGRLLVTGSAEGGAVWRWKNDDLCTEACRRLDRNLSREEWESYLGAVAYRPSCPDLPPGE
jgi:WD40 repeat protein